MSGDVNPRRDYDSSGRQEQARANRRAVVTAAHALFLERGYAGTTVAAVAGGAGVSIETVYKAFRNKPGLVKAALDISLVGDDEPIPMMQRAFVRDNIAEPDPRRKLESYGAHYADLAPRTNPLLLVVRDAAVSDPAAAAVWDQLQDERLTGMTAFAAHLAEAGHLRDGISADEARDVLWTHNSVEVWDLLVNQRGWDVDRLGAWISQQLIAALL